ncbi:hypothetical protein ASD54_05385 [Rhizobium sp. Root149]|uniref:DUF4087 domain-containing protein n=1 Tax=Rhizobium sp. Root149 TaxID=1736473 RepID=UPI00071357FA|nr:DUF4087 domain-containing protein [Rhizobium sp. Root149]KQZ54748.1 hypothetical protein ASD54_05385 [Rhizobium sp. Root149]
MKKRASIALAITFLMATAATAAENRCGWIVNPTPGNYWLDDKEGSWTIMTQGSDVEAKGAENMPDFSAGQFVRTNGYYGYACTCMSVDVDRAEKRITQIHSVKQLALAKCKGDKSLPKPNVD